MLARQERGIGADTIFFLHWLSGSGRAWESVVARLESRFRCVTIDLPGFGDSAAETGYSVSEMTRAVVEVIESYGVKRWMLAGHSMGAKVAAAVAKQAEGGRAGLAGLAGLVLVAGSPPPPEPMDDDRRKKMETWFAGDEAKSRKEAKDFVDANSARSLPDEVAESAVADILRMNRAAWVAWLGGGSREDWSPTVGVLRTPALVVAGEKDPDLGPDGQRSMMLPHFSAARFEVLLGAKHLLPMERPDELATLIAGQWQRPPVYPIHAPVVNEAYLTLIYSDRVSAPTRKALLARSEPDNPGYEPVVLRVEELATLRSIVNRVIPQTGVGEIDLAARLDRQLGESPGDGWRYAELPEDATAYRAGIRTLEHQARNTYKRPFCVLAEDEQDKLLAECAEGKLEPGLLRRSAMFFGAEDETKAQHLLTAAQMKLWFEELRGDAVKLYIAHPAVLAKMGYSGIGDGADADTARGFVQIGVGERELWEPTAGVGVTR